MEMITIFTPIYNRAYIVDKLYQSLINQTSYNFEWLIVDDGSTDHIIELIAKWSKETQLFDIRFYQQQNGGKHRAINYGVKLAEYDAFFIVDSDDYLEEDAVDTILKYWNEIKTDDRIAGISGLRRYDNGEVVGGVPRFREFVDGTNLERSIWGLSGDKAEVYKTKLLRKYPFPEYSNEKFITEAVVWNRIAYEGYKIRWINKSFIICEYLSDGLTAKGKQLFIDNPKGWAHYLCIEKEYGLTEKTTYLKNCYYYYECECMKFSDDEIMEMLNMSNEDAEMVINQHEEFIRRLTDLFKNKKICIYAYGQWDKRIKKYMDYLGIEISYVIDRQYEKIEEINAYSIDMDLPYVDIILIALSSSAEYVLTTIKNKMLGTEVVLLRDIKPALW